MGGATHLYAIGIGSNRRHVRFGRPAGVVVGAIERLDRDFGLFDASPVVLNPAHGGAGREFANAVALIESPLEPPEMLESLKAIERDFGRRRGKRWAARVLDLDIVASSQGRFASRRLSIPHPRLAQRSFVLTPLESVAPAWRVSGGLTPRQLSHRLGKRKSTR